MSDMKKKPPVMSFAQAEARRSIMRRVNLEAKRSRAEKERKVEAKMLGNLFNSASFIDDLVAKFDDHLFQAIATNSVQEQMVLSYEEVEGIRNGLTDASRFLQSIAKQA